MPQQTKDHDASLSCRLSTFYRSYSGYEFLGVLPGQVLDNTVDFRVDVLRTSVGSWKRSVMQLSRSPSLFGQPGRHRCSTTAPQEHDKCWWKGSHLHAVHLRSQSSAWCGHGSVPSHDRQFFCTFVYVCRSVIWVYCSDGYVFIDTDLVLRVLGVRQCYSGGATVQGG